MVLNMFTLFYNKSLLFGDIKSINKNNSPSPTTLLATSILFSVPKHLVLLGTHCKWNQMVFILLMPGLSHKHYFQASTSMFNFGSFFCQDEQLSITCMHYEMFNPSFLGKHELFHLLAIEDIFKTSVIH